MTYAIDPELAEFAAMIAAMPELTDPVEMRAFAATFVETMNASVDVSSLAVDDRTVPGFAGNPDVAVRVYRPADDRGPVPGILYVHGGGFITGSIDTEHGAAAGLARELGVVVVSVEYRLAPEHPFSALVWMHHHAGELGIDLDRLAINGGSAGGGLAAGLALLARDRNGPTLCFQYLGIPELDDRLETPSMTRFVDTPVWSRPAAERSWQWYLGDAYGTDDVSPYASPARATDLAGLPPAYISTMEFDPLRDEGIRYALALLEAGVTVELHSFPGTFHGAAVVADAAVIRREQAEGLAVWRRALALDTE